MNNPLAPLEQVTEAENLENTRRFIQNGEFTLPQVIQEKLKNRPELSGSEEYIRLLLQENAGLLTDSLFASMQVEYLSHNPTEICDFSNTNWMHFVLRGIMAKSSIKKIHLIGANEFRLLKDIKPQDIPSARPLLQNSGLGYVKNTIVCALYFHEEQSNPDATQALHNLLELEFLEDVIARTASENARKASENAVAETQEQTRTTSADGIQEGPKAAPIRRTTPQASPKHSRYLAILLLVSSLIGVAARLYDRIEENVKRMPLFSHFKSSEEK